MKGKYTSCIHFKDFKTEKYFIIVVPLFSTNLLRHEEKSLHYHINLNKFEFKFSRIITRNSFFIRHAKNNLFLISRKSLYFNFNASLIIDIMLVVHQSINIILT